MKLQSATGDELSEADVLQVCCYVKGTWRSQLLQDEAGQ